MPPSTGAPLRTTRGAKPLFDFHYFLWKEKFILGADSRSTLFIPPDIDIPSPLLLLPTPPTDPTNFPIRWSRCKREFKMTTIRSFSFPGMEAEWNWFAAYRSRGSKMSLSLSLEFTLLWKWMNSPFRTFIELCITNNEISSVLREIIKIYESSSFFSFFARGFASFQRIRSLRGAAISLTKYDTKNHELKNHTNPPWIANLFYSSDTINFPLDKRLRFGRSSSPRHLNSAG